MQDSANYIYKRKNGTWYYRRRVPAHIRKIISAVRINKSLKTTNLNIALIRCHQINEITEEEWARIAFEGNNDQNDLAYQLAIKKAQSLNLSYLTNSQLLNEERFEEVMKRISFLDENNISPDSLSAKATLGIVDSPGLSLNKVLDVYFDKISSQDKIQKSDDQVRVWKNPKKRAVQNFIKLNGDVPIEKITRQNAITLYHWWLDRINGVKGPSAKPSTAKKDFTHLMTLYDEYFRYMGDFDRMNPFRNLIFKNMDNDTGVPFPTELIKDMFVSKKFLNLNFEARMIFFAFADTGCRPSELCGLDASNIHLDAPVPYIEIKDKENRKLKTNSSNRTIPLVGTALEAFKKFPKGFKKYKLNETSLSQVVNKFLKKNKFKITPKHTFYSLRHSIIDRMEEVGIEEEFRHRILGHALKQQKYGDGGSLAYKRQMLQRIELKFDKSLFIPD